MTVENFEKALRSRWKRSPFRPFVVELVSGSKIKVEHPEAMAIFPGGLAVHVAKEGEMTILDHEGVAKVSDVGAQRAA